MIKQLRCNQPAGFYIQLLLAAGIAANKNHCLLLTETVFPTGRDSPVNTVGVDGGILQWLQERNSLHV